MKNSRFGRYACLAAAIILSVASLAYSQQEMENVPTAADKTKAQTDCPMTSGDEKSAVKSKDCPSQSDHQAMLMEKGEKEMGFSQTKTTHHFLIMTDGGA